MIIKNNHGTLMWLSLAHARIRRQHAEKVQVTRDKRTSFLMTGEKSLQQPRVRCSSA